MAFKAALAGPLAERSLKQAVRLHPVEGRSPYFLSSFKGKRRSFDKLRTNGACGSRRTIWAEREADQFLRRPTSVHIESRAMAPQQAMPSARLDETPAVRRE